MCSAWVPLDPVPRSGCVELVAVATRRPGETSPPIRGLDLEPGEPMGRPIFPMVWEV